MGTTRETPRAAAKRVGRDRAADQELMECVINVTNLVNSLEDRLALLEESPGKIEITVEDVPDEEASKAEKKNLPTSSEAAEHVMERAWHLLDLSISKGITEGSCIEGTCISSAHVIQIAQLAAAQRDLNFG